MAGGAIMRAVRPWRCGHERDRQCDHDDAAVTVRP
jgi:hypothetical protein